MTSLKKLQAVLLSTVVLLFVQFAHANPGDFIVKSATDAQIKEWSGQPGGEAVKPQELTRPSSP